MTKLTSLPRSATQLRHAISALRSVVADPEVARACKGRIVKVDDRMATERMSIEAFLTFIRDVKPIKVQRNDLYRLNNGLAKHLDKLSLPQSAFALVYFDGQFYLVDGNHRKRAWLNQPGRMLPSHVQITVMVVDSFEEGKAIYACYDSKGAKKTGRDDVLSLLHEAGVLPDMWRSKLIAGGKFITILRKMTQLMCGTANAQTMRAIALSHVEAFKALDRHALDEGDVVAAGVWAALRLYKELPQEFHVHVQNYVEDLRKMGTKTELLAHPAVHQAHTFARKACEAALVGTTGTAPIPVMFPEYLAGFLTYAQALVRARAADRKFSLFVKNVLGPRIVQPEVEQARTMLAQALLKKQEQRQERLSRV